MNYLLLGICIGLVMTGCAQNSRQPDSGRPDTGKTGGPCEGCEAIYESPVPFDQLTAVDTLPDFFEKGPKLAISGIVFLADGITPARDVVIYVYHTDQTGRYSQTRKEEGWGKRHGSIRGWMKTDANGFYKFYTLRPAAYPEHHDPAHIHITVKEPGKNEYWIDEYVFSDDPLLVPSWIRKQGERGGTGILRPGMEGDISVAGRNIFLGKNIPGYRRRQMRSSLIISPGMI